MSDNHNLNKAKARREDEFYTLYEDVESELSHYEPHFKDKTVYCNCDDPAMSEFWRYFRQSFLHLGIKKLIATCCNPNGHGGVFVLRNNNGCNPEMSSCELEEDGDFRSDECVRLLEESDVVVTNPPFSLFKEYFSQLTDHRKKFLIVGTQNAITYKCVFPHMADNTVWLGNRSSYGGAWYRTSEELEKDIRLGIKNATWKVKDGIFLVNCPMVWFTNLDHKKRHNIIDINGNSYSPERYPMYENYRAIEVGKVSEIPCDYDGAMGVPITFMNRYNSEQFEILGADETNGVGFSNGLFAGGVQKHCVADGKCVYKRIFIRRK